jgi:hypothetical protein
MLFRLCSANGSDMWDNFLLSWHFPQLINRVNSNMLVAQKRIEIGEYFQDREIQDASQGIEWFALQSENGLTSYCGKDQVHLGEENIYVSWSFDGEKFCFQNDRYGVYPFFYALQGDRLVGSNSFEFLASVAGKPKWDWDAISAFLYFGYFLGDTTPVKNIKVLPPGSRITARPRLAVEGKSPLQKSANVPRKQGILKYGELFHEAMVSATNKFNPYQVPLSGGKDSRHIFLEAIACKNPPIRCVTTTKFAPKPPADVPVAKMLCEKFQVPHLYVKEQLSRYRAEVQKNLDTHFLSREHAWLTSMTNKASRKDIPYFFDGIAGDVLSAPKNAWGLGLNADLGELFKLRNRAKLSDHYIGPAFDPEVFKKLDLPELENSRERAISLFNEEIDRWRGSINPAMCFRFWNRMRRTISLSPYGVLSRLGVGVCPFLNPDVFDFLYGLPADYLVDGGFHAQAINERFPENRNIPYASELKPPPSRKLLGTYHRVNAMIGMLFFAMRTNTNSAGAMLQSVSQVLSGRAGHPDDDLNGKIKPYDIFYLNMLRHRLS